MPENLFNMQNIHMYKYVQISVANPFKKLDFNTGKFNYQRLYLISYMCALNNLCQSARDKLHGATYFCESLN